MTKKRGFSLVEMLMVVTVIALLLGLFFAFPWNATGQFENSVSGIQGLISTAQAEAIARDTYVWVGFTNTTSSTGLAEVDGAAIFSQDGTSSATGQQLVKVTRWPNVILTQTSQLSTQVQALLPVETGVVSLMQSSTYSPKTFPVMGTPVFVASKSLTFTPQGEVLIDPAPGAQEGYPAAIDLGLRRAAGSSAIANNPDDIVLRIYGGSGKIRQFRLP